MTFWDRFTISATKGMTLKEIENAQNARFLYQIYILRQQMFSFYPLRGGGLSPNEHNIPRTLRPRGTDTQRH